MKSSMPVGAFVGGGRPLRGRRLEQPRPESTQAWIMGHTPSKQSNSTCPLFLGKFVNIRVVLVLYSFFFSHFQELTWNLLKRPASPSFSCGFLGSIVCSGANSHLFRFSQAFPQRLHERGVCRCHLTKSSKGNIAKRPAPTALEASSRAKAQALPRTNALEPLRPRPRRTLSRARRGTSSAAAPHPREISHDFN